MYGVGSRYGGAHVDMARTYYRMAHPSEGQRLCQDSPLAHIFPSPRNDISGRSLGGSGDPAYISHYPRAEVF
jgi:hypothetical protein